jgi:hypothetical protein
MTIIESSGQEPNCPVCKSPQYGDCGHLVADLDRTFYECLGGALYEQIAEFSELVETAFQAHMSANTEPRFEKWHLGDLWHAARESFDPDDDCVVLDGAIFQLFIMNLLEDHGAFQSQEYLIELGGPETSSAISLLFAEDPDKVIVHATETLVVELRQKSVSVCAGEP